MKLFVFICLLSIAFCAKVITNYVTNSQPCTRAQMLILHNKARQNPKWMAGLIEAKYPESQYPSSPAATDKDSKLYYIQQAKLFFKNKFPKYKSLLLSQPHSLAAAEHAHNMANYSYFSHPGCCDSTPTQRMAKYSDLSGLGTGENIWMMQNGFNRSSWTCQDVLVDLVTDIGIPGFGHRLNIYDEGWTHLGLGFGSKVADGWTFSYVVFDYATGKGIPNNTAITENKKLYDYWVQNISCPNGMPFAGQNSKVTTDKSRCPSIAQAIKVGDVTVDQHSCNSGVMGVLDRVNVYRTNVTARRALLESLTSNTTLIEDWVGKGALPALKCSKNLCNVAQLHAVYGAQKGWSYSWQNYTSNLVARWEITGCDSWTSDLSRTRNSVIGQPAFYSNSTLYYGHSRANLDGAYDLSGCLGTAESV